MAFISIRSIDAAEAILAADRQLDGDGIGLRASVSIWLERAPEVRADAVHLVDEADPRHAVLVGLPPHRLGLRLDAGDRVEHRDRAVEHAQRALDFDREVDVAGRVDDVDAVLAPEAGRRRRGDGDAALLFLLHPVHDGRALVDLADLVRNPGVEEDPLGSGRLPGIDVGHDADVPGSIQRCLTGHFSSSVRRAPWAVAVVRRPEPSGSRLRAYGSGLSTTCNARTPCWLPPSGACLRAS